MINMNLGKCIAILVVFCFAGGGCGKTDRVEPSRVVIGLPKTYEFLDRTSYHPASSAQDQFSVSVTNVSSLTAVDIAKASISGCLISVKEYTTPAIIHLTSTIA